MEGTWQEIKSLLSKHFRRVWIPQISELPTHKVDGGLMMDRWTGPCLGASPPNLSLPTMPAGYTDPQTEQTNAHSILSAASKVLCALSLVTTGLLPHTPLWLLPLSPQTHVLTLTPGPGHLPFLRL